MDKDHGKLLGVKKEEIEEEKIEIRNHSPHLPAISSSDVYQLPRWTVLIELNIYYFVMKQNVYYNDILLKPLNKNEPLAIQLKTFLFIMFK